MAAGLHATAEFAADGSKVVVFTPYLTMARARLGKSANVMLVVLGVLVLAPLARLVLSITAMIREFRSAPNAGALIFMLAMALGLLGFFWFMFRWVLKGGTFFVADAEGLAVAVSVGGSLNAVPQQRSKWAQVTDLELSEFAGMPCVQCRTSWGPQRLGMGLDATTCQRVLETMSQLRDGVAETPRAQA